MSCSDYERKIKPLDHSYILCVTEFICLFACDTNLATSYTILFSKCKKTTVILSEPVVKLFNVQQHNGTVQ